MQPLLSFKRWLFRLTPDEKLPIVLDQRRIFILPTPAGAVFALVLMVMLIGAINYNLSLGHALIFLLAGLGIVAMVHTFYNLFDLRLTPGRVPAVFAGDPALFPLRLDNQRQQTRRALDFCFAGQAVSSIDLPAAGSGEVQVCFATRGRGRLDPGRLTLATRYPLGLFRAWSHPQPIWSCIVYPKPIRTALPPAASTLAADHRRGDDGQEDFAGLRPRQPSDPVRHIAWKAVARRPDDQPHLVKQFAGGGAEEVSLDWSLVPPGHDREDRLSILAGWVLAADEQQARYTLRLPGTEIPPGQGEAHRARCLQALALYADHADQNRPA